MKLKCKRVNQCAVLILIVTAAVLIGLTLLAGSFYRAESFGKSGGVSSNADRLAYLAEYGWECEETPLAEERILLPAEFDKTMQRYNLLQQQQGFDLSDYAGLYVMQYRYRVLNYPGKENVEATLYLYENIVIGADIHSVDLGGFMHSLK